MEPAETNVDLWGQPLAAGSMSLAPSCSPLGQMVQELPRNHYRTIVIDPPWPGAGDNRSMKGGALVVPYQTMTGIQLAAMRIDDICTQDANLWMWVTSRHMTDAGLLMQLWGFRYGGLHIWAKPSPTLGKWVRHDTEFLLRGVRPDSRITLPAPEQTHEWPRPKRHSEKPPEAYRMIEELSDGPRIDIFARQARPGFDRWGNHAPDDVANKGRTCGETAAGSP